MKHTGNYFYISFYQYLALLKRFYFTYKRSWFGLLFHLILLPTLLHVGFYLSNISLRADTSLDLNVKFRDCLDVFDLKRCVNVGYVSNPSTKPYVEHVLAAMKKRNDNMRLDATDVVYTSGEIPNFGVVPFDSVETMKQASTSYDKSIYLGFQIILDPATPNVIKYELIHTKLPYQNSDLTTFAIAIEEAIISKRLKDDSIPLTANLDIRFFESIRKFDKTSPTEQKIFPLFLFLTHVSLLFSFLGSIDNDKQNKLLPQMEIMGLKLLPYYASYYSVGCLLYAIQGCVCFLLGLIIDSKLYGMLEFSFFLFIYVLCGFMYLTFAFMLSSIFNDSRISIGVVSMITFVCFIVQTFPGIDMIYSLNQTKYEMVARIFECFPHFHFLRFLVLFSTIFQENFAHEKHYLISWNVLNETKYKLNVPNTSILIDILIYTFVCHFIAWVFLRVLPWNVGRRYPIWFFVLPSYWGFTNSSSSNTPPSYTSSSSSDVLQEQRLAMNKLPENIFVIQGIRKSYAKFGLPINWATAMGFKIKPAVKSLSLCANEGELLALLGHNGAGKTTAMSVIMGLLNWELGDIFYQGKNLRDNLSFFQETMGICPQHDVLFKELSPEEHVELFGGIKLMSKDEIAHAKEELFASFQLTRVKSKACGKFSGGMKRRLSVLIATLGSPKVVIMDEPTTGMDPVNRRNVWSYVEAFKKGRIVFLTTHSMEEAEVLGDKIAIMKAGELQALGSSNELKARLAGGYRISVNTNEYSEEACFGFIKSRLYSATLEMVSFGNIKVLIDASDVRGMFKFLSSLDETGKDLMKEYGISQMTMEDVFHSLSHDHYNPQPLPQSELPSQGQPYLRPIELQSIKSPAP